MTRAMKDSGIDWISEIPEDWDIYRNKIVFSCNKEIVGENSNNTQLLSLTTGGVKTKDIHSVGGKLPESFDTYQYVTIDDIVMCLFDLDMSAVFSGISNYNGMISPAYKVLKCNNNYIIPKYADYWFSFVFVDRKFTSYAKNLRYTLSYDEFGVLPIVLPSLPEQQKIADFLDEKCSHIDSVLEKTRASIDEYKQLKQSVITKAVTKGIRPNRPMKDSGNLWFGNIPSDWNVYKTKYLFSIKKNIAGEEGHTVLSITQKGIVPKDISKNEGQMAENYSKYQLVAEGDFAMNHMDLLTGWIDISNYNGVTSPDYRVFVLNKSDICNKQYYLYLMQMCYFNKIFYGLGQGVSGLGRWRLQADKFLNFCLPNPHISEQEEIVSYLDNKCSEIDKLIMKKEQLIEELETYKKSLIYEYVTGKKEVC